MTTSINLGNGWELSPIVDTDGESVGYLIGGPAAPVCPYPECATVGRCGGLIRTRPTEGRPHWTIVTADPLTLTPSIVCKCKGQHGHVVAGQYVPC